MRDSDESRHFYLEALVTLTAEGLQDSNAKRECAKWFEAEGFNVLPMRAGLLVSGSSEQLTKQLQAARISDLPKALRKWVADISVREPPDYQQ
ncbi:MAG: hypothetical protein QNJ40_06000 [Xanthomonadales bacterium]|nr:hypothetical protein [Xanthomonadales bacterium]